MRGWLSSLTSKIQAIILFLILIFAVSVFTWLTVQHNSRMMKDDLIKKNQLLAAMVNTDQLARLTASETDLASPDYLKIKKQLSLALESIPKGRFLYITGQHPNGEIFFYADNEPAGSDDESPPGQVYHEVSDDFLSVFSSGRSIVEGPFTDRWGTWITALSPIFSPKTNNVIAVLGMDIAAADWHWDVAARSAIPIAFFSMFLIILFSRFVLNKQKIDLTSKPVLNRLLWPLSIAIGIIITGFVSLLWWQQNSFLKKNIEHAIHMVPAQFNQALKIQYEGISTAITRIAEDADLQERLASKNKEQFAEHYEPLMNDVSQYYEIDYLYFLTDDRTCMLSINHPHDKKDYIIDHGPTFQQAEETHMTASGIELNPLGTLAIKIVYPVLRNDQLIGYIVLEKDLEGILNDLIEPGIDLAVTLRKERIQEEHWKHSMALLNREADWDAFPDHVLTYSSIKIFPDQIKHILEKHNHYSIVQEIEFNDKTWQISLIPLYDPTDHAAGDIFILHDISDQKASFRRLILISGGLLAILLTALFSFLFVILRWTDREILAGEKQLRDSERNYRELIDGMNETVWVIDLDGTIIDVNKKSIDVLGYSKHELIKNKLYMIDKSLKKENIDRLISAMPSDKIQIFETFHTTKDGRIIPVEINSSFVIYQGKPAILSIARDITERKRAEDALRESEKQFKALFMESPVSILIHDKDTGEIVDANPTACAMYGLSSVDDLKTMNIWLKSPYSFNDAFSLIKKTSTCGHQQFEWLNRRITGEFFWEQVHLTRVTIKGVERIMATAIDITERKKAEDALKESENRFQSVVSNLPGVIFRCRHDEHWTMEFLSKQIHDITGYPAAEFLQNNVRSYQSIIHPDDAPTVAKTIDDAISQKMPYSLEYRIMTVNGMIKWVQENGQGFFSEQGELMYIDGVIMDITQQRQIEEEIKNMQDQLAQSKKMAAVGKLSAGVAHEIKNPLAIILLSIDSLTHSLDVNETNRKILDMIKISAQRADKIVTDLLNFSRHSKLNLKPTHPAVIIHNAVASIQETVSNQHIRIEEIHTIPEQIIINVDPLLMEHVLLNILNNAIDAMPGGGDIRIETSLQTASAKKNYVIIKISDNGCGIPKDIIDRIFEPFVTTKEVGKGTGLGLSLAYTILERHNGTITVESSTGNGATFTIQLPCHDA